MTVTGWINIYKDAIGCIYCGTGFYTKLEEAQAASAHKKRHIKCISVILSTHIILGKDNKGFVEIKEDVK